MSIRPTADASPPAYTPVVRAVDRRIVVTTPQQQQPQVGTNGKKSKKGLAFALGMVMFWATLLGVSLYFTPW
jgi:hypothetical protein